MHSSDLSKAPEFLLLFITTAYVILFIVLYVTEPRGVPLLRMKIEGKGKGEEASFGKVKG